MQEDQPVRFKGPYGGLPDIGPFDIGRTGYTPVRPGSMLQQAGTTPGTTGNVRVCKVNAVNDTSKTLTITLQSADFSTGNPPPTYSDDGSSFTAYPATQPQREIDSAYPASSWYAVGYYYECIELNTGQWIVTCPAAGYTGSVKIVHEVCFDADGCVSGWMETILTFRQGRLLSINPDPQGSCPAPS